ncbi:MAG TPA: helix-turn-helix domain-containing protein, partial [Candidatus Dormibacteraeota bacterium]|nr:helix-turn-helix domain-containing protein [Candidatus Dormibacteraeota bacterium]
MSGSQPAAAPRRARPAGVDVRPGSVRQARQEAGLSRARLAEPELTRGAIYLIEAGRSRPSMSTLRLIAARTGRPLSYFLAGPTGEWQRLTAEVAEAEALRLAGRADEAVARCEAALPGVADAHLEARALRCLGRAELDLGRAGEARSHLERAQEAFTRAGDPWSAAECLVLLAQAAGPDALAAAEDAIAACAALAPPPDVHLAAAHAAAGDALAADRRWEEAAGRYAIGLQ